MMRRNTLPCSLALACAVLGLVSLHAFADDKDKPALSGSWVKHEGELKIEFTDKENLKIVPHGDEAIIAIRCSYTVEKGTVKVKITGFEGKDEAMQAVKDKLPAGSEFSFQWTVKDDSSTLDGVKGTQADLLKSHLEGKYDKKK